jgi:hypothetical protein
VKRIDLNAGTFVEFFEQGGTMRKFKLDAEYDEETLTVEAAGPNYIIQSRWEDQDTPNAEIVLTVKEAREFAEIVQADEAMELRDRVAEGDVLGR